jgi:hypothetical protein
MRLFMWYYCSECAYPIWGQTDDDDDDDDDDNEKNSIYKELMCVFNQFSKYNMKIFSEFSRDVGKKDIF